MKEKIRIASGQGFWRDMLDAPVQQAKGGQIDYLMLDYLAEVTMSIRQKQRAPEPARAARAGWGGAEGVCAARLCARGDGGPQAAAARAGPARGLRARLRAADA